jgi:hypothetical protein
MVMETKHTPGPWSIEPHGNKTHVLYSGRDSERHGYNLVYLSDPDRNWDANARLISAAPTLYEALRDLQSLVASMDATAEEIEVALEAARAAIAKAEGR